MRHSLFRRPPVKVFLLARSQAPSSLVPFSLCAAKNFFYREEREPSVICFIRAFLFHLIDIPSFFDLPRPLDVAELGKRLFSSSYQARRLSSVVFPSSKVAPLLPDFFLPPIQRGASFSLFFFRSGIVPEPSFPMFSSVLTPSNILR